MIAVFQQALATIPVIAALLVVRALNLPKAHRVRQYPMPAVAAIYAAFALVVLYLLNSWINDVLNAIFHWVPFLRGLYDARSQFIIENVAVVVVFVAVKYLFRRIFDRTFRGERFLGSSLVEDLYRYDTDFGMWFVRRRNAMLRVYLKVFYWASVALMAVFMAASATNPAWPGFVAIAFPALAVLVIGEVYFATDGVTEHEFRRDILGERDRAERVANYAGLREVLKETFPRSVLDDGVDFSSDDATHTFDRLENLARSASDVDQLAGAYFSRLKQSGTVLDTNLIDAAVDLMRGRSVLINNPFYGDLSPYLIFPVYYHLLHYRKCLVLCGRDAIADDLVGWMRDGLETITGVPDLWRVGVLRDDADPHLDVGILRFADIHNLDLIRANDEFLSGVEYVIMTEPSRILATGQVGLGVLLSRCGDAPVFAAFDRNHDGLVDALSHQLKVDLTNVVAAPVPRGVSTRMLWRADGTHMHASVLPSVSRYLGTGTEIGAVALKYQVSRVDWIGADAFPVHDMMWIAGQYFSQITSFADLDVSQHALSEVIQAKSNPWDIPPADHRFLIVEDEIRNVYESLRLYATRADLQGFVNLVSEEYLLRDYMVDNAAIFADDPKAIPSFAADRARTERNLVLQVMLRLLAFGVSERELVREFELIGELLPPIEAPVPGEHHDDDPPVVSLLRRLIGRHTTARDVHIDWRIASTDGPERGEEQFERLLRIKPTHAVEDVVRSLRSAYFFVEDEREDRNYIGAALHGLVHQQYLPGQFITYAGKYYEVQGVGDGHRRGGVILRRAADHIRDRRVYRMLRDFRITEITPTEQAGAHVVVDGVDFARCYATIEVRSLGYLESPSRADLAGARRVMVSGVPTRAYPSKEMLRVRMPGVPASVRKTIALLLNELFVTVFPHAHAYLTAVTVDDERAFGDLLPSLTVDPEDAVDAIYIVEDSMVDLGLLVAVQRHWRRLLEIMTDYLAWREAPPPAEPSAAPQGTLPVFPGDGPAEIAERARIASEQDAAATQRARAPKRSPWWRRVWRRAQAGFATRGRNVAASQDAPIGVVAPLAPAMASVEPLTADEGAVSVDVSGRAIVQPDRPAGPDVRLPDMSEPGETAPERLARDERDPNDTEEQSHPEGEGETSAKLERGQVPAETPSDTQTPDAPGEEHADGQK